ncbi:hypothetical protein ACWD4G_10440 [Streptomyces sp. NPDC002643]
MGLWVTLPPEPGEEVLCTKTGAVLVPGTELALIGGILVLTNRRLYHGPLDTRLAGRLLSASADLAGPTGAGGAIELLIGWVNKARAVPLGEITAVEPIRKASLQVTTQDGKRRNFGIAADWKTPVWSRNNPPHRDQMVAHIRRAIADATSGT